MAASMWPATDRLQTASPTPTAAWRLRLRRRSVGVARNGATLAGKRGSGDAVAMAAWGFPSSALVE